MLLAIDTSSLILSCALAKEDTLISEWTVQRKLTHSEQLIPHIDEMMKDAGLLREDITAVACSIGPGSFTGLRIGLTSAKMMSYLWKVPLIGVDTLEALAWNLCGGYVYALPLMDAQRGHVYAALYNTSHMRVIQEEAEGVFLIEEVIEKVKGSLLPVVAMGEAAEKYADKLKEAGILLAPQTMRCCRAGSVAMAAWQKLKKNESSNPLTMVPNYIRRSEAEVQWEKRHGKV